MYPNNKNRKSEGPALLKITITNDEIQELKIKTEKQAYENFLKSLRIDGEYYKKKYKNLKKKKV